MGSLPATASDEVLPPSELTFPHPNDPALYVKHNRSPEFIRKMLDAGPCQPGLNCPYDFPKTDGRSFRRQWYYVKMKNGMIRYRDWLVYSPDSALSFPCWLFANRNSSHYDPAFLNQKCGYSKWKKATEAFDRSKQE